MNYYEHHIGDYDEATAHLTACEDGIYSRLIRKYYSTEKPLPNDVSALQRLVRARSRDEKAAVKTVLEEFFELRDDGWHQKRCDEDLVRYLDKKRKAQASANARWTNRDTQSERNANASKSDMRTDSERNASAYANASETHDERNAHQSPVTSHQTPEVGNPIVSGTASREMADDFTPKNEAEWLRHFKAKHGFDADPTNVNDRKRYWPTFAGWANAGISTRQVDAAVAKALTDSKEPISNIVTYAARVLDSMNAPPRASPRSYHDERADVIAQLTGRKAAHQPSDAGVIDVNDSTPRLGS